MVTRASRRPAGRRASIDAKAGRRAFLLCFCVALVLLFPAAAKGTHDGTGYWFFRGWLPTSSGVFTKHHAGGCCGPLVVVRMSWEQYTHDMKFIFIAWSGAWHGYWAHADTGHSNWDITQGVASADYARGGCQNPPEVNWWVVWVNCHVRNTA
jgi:hypothetical protein